MRINPCTKHIHVHSHIQYHNHSIIHIHAIRYLGRSNIYLQIMYIYTLTKVKTGHNVFKYCTLPSTTLHYQRTQY